MSEALAELIRFLFEEVGVNRIEALHDVRNPNQGKVMQKCGMKTVFIAMESISAYDLLKDLAYKFRKQAKKG